MNKINIYLCKSKKRLSMLFSEINPRIRYARYFNLDEKACYKEVVPVDARLFYVLNGHGKIQVKDKEYEMTPFSLLIINSKSKLE